MATNNAGNKNAFAQVTPAELQEILASDPQGTSCACPPGFTFTVYDHRVSQHYFVASENVKVTRGAIKYVDHHQRYGAQTRFRFQLCYNYLHGKCTKAGECSYIHATHLPAPTVVHLNPFAPRNAAREQNTGGSGAAGSAQDDPATAEHYPVLDPGLFLPVFPPVPPKSAGDPSACRVSANAAVVVVPSDRIIRTRGAEFLLRAVEALPLPLRSALESQESAAAVVAGQPGQPSLPLTFVNRARHCAHFQFKRVCNMGEKCHYIHSKAPLLSRERFTAQDRLPAMSLAFSSDSPRRRPRDSAEPLDTTTAAASPEEYPAAVIHQQMQPHHHHLHQPAIFHPHWPQPAANFAPQGALLLAEPRALQPYADPHSETFALQYLAPPATAPPPPGAYPHPLHRRVPVFHQFHQHHQQPLYYGGLPPTHHLHGGLPVPGGHPVYPLLAPWPAMPHAYGHWQSVTGPDQDPGGPNDRGP